MRDLKVKQFEEKVDIDTLDDLVTFKETLPDEHFLHHKIDELVLNRVSLNDDAEKLFG